MPAELPIDEVLEGCRKQNHNAQMEVYRRFHKMLFHSVLRLVRNPQDAEDIMQESFITAFEKLDQYKGENRFGGWLKQIAIRKALYQIEQNQKTRFGPDAQYLADKPMEIETTAPKRTKQLFRALEKINPRYRHVLYLHFLEGLDPEEICTVMEILPGTYRTLLSRAKKQLKQKINEDELGKRI